MEVKDGVFWGEVKLEDKGNRGGTCPDLPHYKIYTIMLVVPTDNGIDLDL